VLLRQNRSLELFRSVGENLQVVFRQMVPESVIRCHKVPDKIAVPRGNAISHLSGQQQLSSVNLHRSLYSSVLCFRELLFYSSTKKRGVDPQ